MRIVGNVSGNAELRREGAAHTTTKPKTRVGRDLLARPLTVTEICSELGYGVVDGVGGHTECLRDRICPESQDEDIELESESESGSGKVVGKGVPLQKGSGGKSKVLKASTSKSQK